MSELRFVKIESSTFQIELYLIIGEPEQIKKRIGKELGGKLENEVLTDGRVGEHFVLTSKKGDFKRFILLKRFDWAIDDMAMLCHEVCHFIMRVFKDKGVPISEENTETFAYLYDEIIEKLLNELKPKKKKRKNRIKRQG